MFSLGMISLGLLSSLGSTAYALEDDFTFDLEGYYRMRGYSFSNLYADQEEPGRFIAQRLRLQPQLNYQDMAKFNKKAIVIPSNVYFEFVNCISKAYQHFQDGKEEPFEEVIYRHSKVHWIVGKYEMDEDSEEMNLKIIIKWNFAKDR